MKFWHYILKRKIENIFIFPFIIIGRLIAFFSPLKKEYHIFFFFPFYHTGGAEKVHALITQATRNKNCIIYFTRKSVDDNFKNDSIKIYKDLIDENLKKSFDEISKKIDTEYKQLFKNIYVITVDYEAYEKLKNLGFSEIRISLSAYDIKSLERLIQIKLTAENLFSPSNYGMSDNRYLGVALKRVELKWN